MRTLAAAVLEPFESDLEGTVGHGFVEYRGVPQDATLGLSAANEPPAAARTIAS